MFIFVFIGLMIVGVGIGYLLRNKKLHFIHNTITVLIWVLLFLLGVEVGLNEKVIKGLHTIGLEALFITVVAMAGSVFCAWILWRMLTKKEGKEGKR